MAKSSPQSLQLEKACMQQWRPNAAKKKIKEKKKKKMKKKNRKAGELKNKKKREREKNQFWDAA